MYNIKNVIGWIGNIAVLKSKTGYVLVDWSCAEKKLEVDA